MHAENKATHQECSILIKEEKRNDRKMKNQVRELSNDKEEQMDQETQERKEECKRLEEGLELKEEVLWRKSTTCRLLRRRTRKEIL